MLNKDIKKAIPGGKYGCALMLKNCGSEKLKKMSLGKIVSFVSFALKKEINAHREVIPCLLKVEYPSSYFMKTFCQTTVWSSSHDGTIRIWDTHAHNVFKNFHNNFSRIFKI